MTPLESRGPRAWEDVNDGLGSAHPDVTRLLAHAGVDATQLTYFRHVREVLERWQARGVERLSHNNLDRLLANEFDRMCYLENRNPGAGQQLFSGFIGLFPELHGNFPRANRALKAWLRDRPGNEGSPLAEEAIYWAALEHLKLGRVYHAFWLLLSLDCFLRSGHHQVGWV